MISFAKEERQLFGTTMTVQTFWTATLIGLGLCLIGRLYSLTGPTLSIDDYGIFYKGNIGEPYREITGGRTGIYLLTASRQFLGIDYLLSSPLTPFLAMAMLAATGTFIGGIIFANNHLRTIYFCAFYCCHPYLTEYFYFNSASFQIVVSFFLAFGGIFFSYERAFWKTSQITLCAIAILTSLFIYTATVAYVGALMLLMPLVSLANGQSRRQLIESWMRIAALYVICLALYFVANQLILFALGLVSDRAPDMGGLISTEAALGRISTTLSVAYGAAPGIITPGAHMLLLVCLVLCISTVLVASRRSPAIVPLGILGSFGVVLAFLWSPTVIPFFQPIGWSALRLISPVAVPVAVILALGLSLAGGRWFGKLLMTLVVISQISFLATSNRMLYEQRLLNDWDAKTADRVLARLENNPDFLKVRRLFVTGAHWARSQPLTTTFADLNPSSLAVDWAKLGVFAIATGYRFEQPSVDEAKRAKAYCASIPEWPDDRATTIVGELAIVCL